MQFVVYLLLMALKVDAEPGNTNILIKNRYEENCLLA